MVTELTCPRCGYPIRVPEQVPTFRGPGPEVLLVRPACGHPVAAGPGGTAVVGLTPDVLLRASAVERALAEDLAGPGLYLAGQVRPGWVCAVSRAMAGGPRFRVPPAAEAATAAAVDRLRSVDWTPATDDVQLGPVREHYDAIAAWVRAVGRPELWPGLQPPVLIRDDPDLVRAALTRLSAEPWYAALPSDAPARADLVYWLVWLTLDAAGEIPAALPDPYEPLILAYGAGGVIPHSRELRGELRLGPTTLRLPPSVDAWPERTPPPRRTLYRDRDC